MKTFRIILISLSIMTVLSACKKDDSDDYQPKGNYGNANITSQTYTADWEDQGGGIWNATLIVPAITESVLSTGAINTYYSGNEGDTWAPLPLSMSVVDIVCTYKVDTVEIIVQGASSEPTADLFRVVVVSSAGMSAHPNVDYNNYEEVKSIFDLED